VSAARRDDQRNRSYEGTIGFRYAIGAAAACVAAVFAGWWGLILGWIAISLAIMSAGYCFAGSRVYCKRSGRIPQLVRVLFAPHMIGVYVTRVYRFRRMSAPYQRVCSNVWLGRMLREREAREFINTATGRHIRAVLDLTAEHNEAPSLRALHYRNIAILDMTAPTVQQLQEAVRFIDEHQLLGVYVHCALGHARSAAVLAAFLLYQGAANSVDEAIGLVKAARPGIALKRHVVDVLRAFHRRHCAAQTVNPPSS
jgi:protein-tyrosine phosphatase